MLNAFHRKNVQLAERLIKEGERAMTDKHFNAILAKNRIAQELARGEHGRELGTTVVSTAWIMSNLRDIEAYTGTGNQPSVDDTYNEEG